MVCWIFTLNFTLISPTIYDKLKIRHKIQRKVQPVIYLEWLCGGIVCCWKTCWIEEKGMLILLNTYNLTQMFPGTQNAGECTILLVILKKNPGVKPPAPLWAARKRVAFRACGPQRVTICGGPPLWKMARSAPAPMLPYYYWKMYRG